jgi:hypothetical protein
MNMYLYYIILYYIILYYIILYYVIANSTYVSSIRIYIERVLNNTEFQNILMVNSLLQFVPQLGTRVVPRWEQHHHVVRTWTCRC